MAAAAAAAAVAEAEAAVWVLDYTLNQSLSRGQCRLKDKR